MNTSKNNWLFALILTLPMIVFYGGYYLNHIPELRPTGFITYDNVSYVAYAKEYLDHDRFSLFYSNAFNDSGNYPGIYFQTQTVFLALLLSIGLSPGFTIVLLNWLGTLLSFKMAIAIYDHLYPNSSGRKLFISFFCWGGGLLALAGIPIALTKIPGQMDFLDRMFFIDPAGGWWGLNFGRGHFNSVEGYFHFLFLSGILCLLKQKWNLCLAISLVLSVTHPFTGIEYLVIVTSWSFIEKFFFRNQSLPWTFPAGIALILAFHIFYYLIYLNQFAAHRSVSEQFTLNWRLRFFNMIPAYFLVGLFAIGSLLKWKREFFKYSSNRLFLCWTAFAILLSNHELFMKPTQPLHFTRGYIWTGLFLLGLPALQYFYSNERIKKRKAVLILFSLLFFSDNFLWIVNNVRTKGSSPSVRYVTDEQRNLLKLINKNSDNKTLVIGKDPTLPYLSTVYTKAYPWISHPYTTPFSAKKEAAYNNFIENNKLDAAWSSREVLLIFRKNVPGEFKRSQSLSFPVTIIANTSSYIIEKGVIPK